VGRPCGFWRGLRLAAERFLNGASKTTMRTAAKARLTFAPPSS
jgi:hypothetical protein